MDFNNVYNVNYSDDINIQIGDMNIICNYCQARRYKEEDPGICCSNGKYPIEVLVDSITLFILF